MAETTFHSITLPGRDPARVPLTAIEFNPQTNYKVRDYCTYQGILYRCTATHSAGTWDSTKNYFTATNSGTNIGDELNNRLVVPSTTKPNDEDNRIGDLWIDPNTESPVISVDPQPIAGSTNVPQSGGTFSLIKNLDNNKASKSLLTGDFSATSPYSVNDLCIHNGYLYRCKVDIPTGTAWDSSKWETTTIKDELARIESEEVDLDVIAETFGDSNSYAVGDYVLHTKNGVDGLYRCTNAVSETSLWNDNYWTEVKLADEVSDLKSALDDVIEIDGNLFDKTDVDLRELYLNNRPSNMIVSNVSATPARLIVIPIENNTDYVVNLKYGTSTKRVATTINNPANGVPIDNALEFVGEINNCIIHNTTGNYLCIQLFINADTDKTASNYYDYVQVSVEGKLYTAVDIVAREKVTELNEKVDGLDVDKLESDVDALKDKTQNTIIALNLFDKENPDLRELYLNSNLGTISNVDATPARLIVVPIENNKSYVVDLKYGTSTKRVATTINNPANGVVISNYQQFVGEIDDCVVENTTGNYLCIQLFINADTDKTASNYYDYIEVWANGKQYTAVDIVAREKISELQTQTDSIEQTANNNEHEIDTLKGQIPQYFFTENLSGLPILNSMTDVIVDANTWDNSADFHAMVKTLCDNSDGYITQHLMGEDAHSNELYYYRTHPKLIYYDCDRESVAPAYPPAGGYIVKPFRIIITSNIHYREKNGNYVMYNLLQKMLSADSGMLKFFYNNCEFIWIPCCCPSANAPDGYINADGQNVNRSFPTTKDGAATCPEAVLIKTVFDEFGDTADVHLDLHTFGSNSNFVTWLFTDNLKLGARGARIAEDVLQEYRAKYPHSVFPTQALNKSGGGFINTPTTSSYYMEKVYGIPAATIEIQREIGTSVMDFNTKVTNATAVFYDLVTQTLIGMVR